MRQIDVHKLADDARFNGFHGLVLLWCALIIVFDGYDLAVAGIALPSIMKEMGVDATSAGYSLGSALTFVLVLNAGAIAGAVGGGWLADRFHIKHVLVGMYLLAAASITLLGYKLPTGMLYLVVALAGASTIGTQIVTCAYCGQFYPMAVRSTGLGFMLGIGRAGAILAPIVIGTLVGMALPLQQNFVAIAIPAVIAAAALTLIDHRRSASAHHEDVSAEVPDAAPERALAAGTSSR
ncbi:MFS transporter [Thauera sinica]|uniref:MFS transporter n=1 Tax=Thauera sinica TaxID=2665146 RepID=A0ABW1AVR2_9RHOO|nr:MFS transporter [Thauera sp. K11]ATE61165.1 hypothetical protein CCZ27_15555 [Thauera sp. K11]